MKDESPYKRPVLSYEASTAPQRRLQFGNLSLAIALIVLVLMAWVIAGSVSPEAVEGVISAAWRMSVGAFGFGAAGIIWDRRIRFSVVGSAISIVEIILVFGVWACERAR